ncbi:MAG: chain-length determining protein, partial [Prevotellaceae bacterium]|nr:chain-length determining protein [Prevotellaceae bacterium]
AQQLQLAKVKVQDMTPVYTIIQPSVVPLNASSPRKILILVGLIFVSFVGACGWIFVKQSFLSVFMEKKDTVDPDNS